MSWVRAGTGRAVVFAATLALSTGLVHVVPAGAAAGTTCGNVYGFAKFKPALPQRGATTKVKTTITITGAHVGSCSGGRVYSGTLNASLTAAVAGNCTSFANHVDLKLRGTAKVTWNDKGTSVIAAAQLVPVRRQHFIQLTLTGKVSAHKFAGSTLTSELWFSNGGCATGPMSSAKIRRAAPLTIG